MTRIVSRTEEVGCAPGFDTTPVERRTIPNGHRATTLVPGASGEARG
jgi:hypothetical protein